MVSSNYADEKVIWDYIWSIRFKYVREDKEDIKCLGGNFISEKQVGQNFNELVNLLEVFNISETVNNKISKNKIEIGGKMFASLNSCPSVFIRLYKKILYGPHQSSIAIQALNVLKNTGREFRPVTTKIFAFIISTLGFKYINTYENLTSENSDTNTIFQNELSRIRGTFSFLVAKMQLNK